MNVGSCPYLDPLFDWLRWQVLFQAGSSLEGDHHFIHCLLTVGVVALKEYLVEVLDHGSNLSKVIVSLMASWC